MNRPLAAIALTLALSALSAVPASASARPPRLLTADDSTAFAVRPSTILLTADGGELIGRLSSGRRRGYLHWSHWSRRSASATASYWVNICRPNCSRGKFRLRHVTLQASRPRGGHFEYISLRLHFHKQWWSELLYCEHDGSLWSWVSTEGWVKGRTG